MADQHVPTYMFSRAVKTSTVLRFTSIHMFVSMFSLVFRETCVPH